MPRRPFPVSLPVLLRAMRTAILGGVLAMAAALCAAQPLATSAPATASAAPPRTLDTPGPPAVPAGPAVPAPPDAPSTPDTAAGAGVPDATAPAGPAAPAATFGPPPPSSPPLPPLDIALVLPLGMPAYARAADAVRAGFMAAAGALGGGLVTVVIPHAQDGVIAAFDDAKARGARVIVGPLLRDDLRTLSIAGGEWPVTIALNQLDDAPLPPRTYSLALGVESDARVIARRLQADGVRAVDVVEGDSSLVRRLSTAFVGEWMAAGGAIPSAHAVELSPASLGTLRRALAKSAPGAVLLALDGERAAIVKPYLGSVTTYASGLVFERPEFTGARDVDDIRVVEIPWIVAPDAPEFDRLPRRDLPSAALTRLYALGLDAFRVARAFVDGPPERLELDGAIGRLTLDERRQFVREGRLAVYRDGQLVPLDAAR